MAAYSCARILTMGGMPAQALQECFVDLSDALRPCGDVYALR